MSGVASAIGAPIIKLGTSIAGGVQSRNAVNDAVAALLQSFGAAGNIATDAVNKVNPEILGTAADQGGIVTNTAADWGGNVINAANQGADAVTAAAQAGQEKLNPYATAGTGALDTLSRMLQKPETFQFQADPGYQFRLSEGMKAIQRSAAAHGASGGGGTAKALAQYGSGLASQEYNNAWQRWDTGRARQIGGLSTLAGMGERASEFGADLGTRAATYGAGLRTGANQFAGSLNTGASEWAGSANINARNFASQNSLDLANFLANLEINKGKTIGAGDISKSNIWNNLIKSFGDIGMSVFSSTQGKKPGIDWGNLGPPVSEDEEYASIYGRPR